MYVIEVSINKHDWMRHHRRVPWNPC